MTVLSRLLACIVAEALLLMLFHRTCSPAVFVCAASSLHVHRPALQDAPAAWIPIIFEIAGCLLVLFLKLFYEHTAVGRRFSAATAQQQQLTPPPLQDIRSTNGTTNAAQHWGDGHWEPPHGHHRFAALGQAAAGAAAAVGNSGDISWRGRAVLGQHQEPPHELTVAMIDVSNHGGSRHHDSVHVTRSGSNADSRPGLVSLQQQQQQREKEEEGKLSSKGGQGLGQETPLEVKCTGTSVGSCSSSSISVMQDSSRAALLPAQPGLPGGSVQQQQQQQQPREPLFASSWSLQPVAAVTGYVDRQHQHHQ
jgi:hypothetical protein